MLQYPLVLLAMPVLVRFTLPRGELPRTPETTKMASGTLAVVAALAVVFN